MNSATVNKKPFFNDYSVSKETISGPFLFVKRNNVHNVHLTLVSEDYLRQDMVQTLDEARSCLMKMQLSKLPELIILEIPLNLKELTVFKNWLSQNVIPPIPVIYKESYLNRSEIKNLFRLNLIDDVIKDDPDTALLYEKVKFFRSLTVQSLIGAPSFKIGEKIRKPIHREIIKKAIDIFLSLSILLALSPLLALIAILIKLTSKGPVIYKSKRAGEGYKIFNFYKFRTMVNGAEEMLDSLRY